MAETLKVALDNPFNFIGTLILICFIGNMIVTLLGGIVANAAIKAIPQCKCRCENKEQKDTQ